MNERHWTNQYVGIPFEEGGNSRNGVSCWGLVQLVYREQLNLDLPAYGDISAYDLIRISRAWSVEKEAWQPIDRASVREFDAVGMIGRRVPSANGRKCRTDIHVGLFVTGGRVLHADVNAQTVCIDMNHYSVRSRIVSFWRLKNRACS